MVRSEVICTRWPRLRSYLKCDLSTFRIDPTVVHRNFEVTGTLDVDDDCPISALMYCEPSGNHIELESEGEICHRVEKDPHSDPNSERYPYMCNDEHGFHGFARGLGCPVEGSAHIERRI